MDPAIIIPLVLFGSIFGIFYLFISSRNKERLALIEKGADASIFTRGTGKSPVSKVIILNLSLLLMGIGLGIFIATLIDHFTSLDSDTIYPATIFLMAGIGLFIGFKMTSAMDEK
ncbi:hypothetical protein QSV08_19365 [Maribacter sp. BPC-D8]|uniref:DUF6249 domain-containing protein n=1 Tax=Maribacter sp. BPC-D8 TaxID=3053613 RepID=UPI002B4A817B|nr:DUF6249 domain-containing protein [Maribacter sp. BPC-D8]WRI29366.1 hypothetical protein QSV08_19365 [Maribacter sp. BPC-D8]